MKVLHILMLFALVGSSRANAQVQQADSVPAAARLRAIRFGSSVRVHTAASGWTEGAFRRADSLLIVGDEWRLKKLPMRDVDAVWIRSKSGASKGAAIGGAVGGLLAGLLMGAVCADPDNSCGARAIVSGAVVGGFIGLVPGVLIGATMAGPGTWSPVYP